MFGTTLELVIKRIVVVCQAVLSVSQAVFNLIIVTVQRFQDPSANTHEGR